MNDLSQLKPKLARLRMSGVLDNLDLRLSQACDQNLPYEEFLHMLFQDEIDRRSDKQLQLRLKRSDLDLQKTIDAFDFTFNATMHSTTIRECMTLRFITQHESIFFVGPSGVGKSHLAMAIGNHACRKGYTVLFRRTHELLKWLNAGRADGSYDRRMAMVSDADLLIMDDFGLQEMSAIQQSDLFDLISARYEVASTIITSNRDIPEWTGLFSNPLVGNATIDRLVHRAIRIEIDGRSYRLERFREMNKGAALETQTALTKSAEKV
jgi:DNA replication protein DnaC